MEKMLSRDTGPGCDAVVGLSAYAAMIRFNGEPSIADLMATFARVLDAGSRSEILAICGGLPDLGLPLY